MSSWFFPALLALLMLGVQRFFYKVAAEKKYPTEWVTFSFMATVTLMSAGAYFFREHQGPDIVFLMVAALVNSAAFLVATVSHIEALKYVPANIAYSFIRLNVVLVAVFSIFYFNEQVTPLQILGLVVAVAAMLLMTTQMRTDTPASKKRQKGALFIFLTVLGGSAASVSSKFAAMYTDKFAFMAVSYLFGMIGTLGINKALSYKKATQRRSAAVGLGVLMGGFNFAGFYAFLYALERGPLSLIAAIAGMHFIIAIVLSAVVFHEKIKSVGVAGIVLTVISILLIRM